MGRGGVLHGLRRAGPRFHRGDAGSGHGDVPPASGSPVKAPRGEDETTRSARGSGVHQHGRPRVRLRTGGDGVTALQDMMRALRDVTKAEAVAVINRDGGIVVADLPRTVSPETFSIMCAAILGAGMTAATELGHAAPHRVLLESNDVTVVIQEIGRRAMVVLVVPPERVVSDLDSAISRFAQAAAKDVD